MNKTIQKLLWAAGLLTLWCLLLTGCNSKTVTVTVTGRCLVTDNGQYLIVTDSGNEPTVLHPRNGDVSLFGDARTGDQLCIYTDGEVQCTYPAKMNASRCTIVARGSVADVPQTVLKTLQEMGWTFKTE